MYNINTIQFVIELITKYIIIMRNCVYRYLIFYLRIIGSLLCRV